MFKQLTGTLLICVFINLIFGQYTPCLAQDNSAFLRLNHLPDYSLRNIDKSFVLPDTSKNLLPPLSAGKIIGEYALGTLTGSASAFITALCLAGVMDIEFDVGGSSGSTSGFEYMVFFTLVGASQIFGSAGGVWLAGTDGIETANFWATVLGSTAGFGLQILGFFLTSSLTEDDATGLGYFVIGLSLTLPAASGTIGLNATRQLKPKSNSGSTALLNFNRSRFSVTNPSFYIEPDKTIQKKPVTFAKILSFNF